MALGRFCGVEAVGLEGADFQPLSAGFCRFTLGVAFLERELDLVGYPAGVVDFRDLAGDAL